MASFFRDSPGPKRTLSPYPTTPTPGQPQNRDCWFTPSSTPTRATPIVDGGNTSKYFKNANFRNDERFKPFKTTLSASNDLLSFVYDPSISDGGYLQRVKYPLDPDGNLVSPDNLATFLKSFDWDMPTCFCSIRDGGAVKLVKLYLPMSVKSESRGKMCLVCRDASCSYFVNLVELLANNTTIYSGYCVPKPLFGPQDDEESMTVSSLTASSQGKQRAKARDVTPKARDVTLKPKTLQRYGQDKKRIKIESSSGSLPVASSESHQQVYSGYAGLSLNFKEDIPTTIRHNNVPIADAIATIVRLMDPTNPGITYAELVRSLFRCSSCDKVMMPHWAHNHRCIFGRVETSESGEESDEIQILRHIKPNKRADNDSDVEILN